MLLARPPTSAARRRGGARGRVRGRADLMEQWYGEAMSAAEARDLADADADTALNERRALLPDASATATPAACACCSPATAIGQVEEVYTAKPLPRRGPGYAVVARRDRRRQGAATS